MEEEEEEAEKKTNRWKKKGGKLDLNETKSKRALKNGRQPSRTGRAYPLTLTLTAYPNCIP